jgi:hypothetical protein
LTVSVPAVVSAARTGSWATIAGVETELWPLPMMRSSRRAARADGRVMSGPATEPIWIQSTGRLASVLYFVGGLAFRVAWIETGKATVSWCPDELTTVRITSAP